MAQQEHRILVLTYWSYDDPLIQTYTLPYLRIIKNLSGEKINIRLVTMEKKHADCDRVSATRDPDFSVTALPYYPFGAKAMIKWLKNISSLKKLIRQENINTIHSWCTPAGMIGWLLQKRTKTRFIADSFEPHAEAMVENGTWKKNSLAFKILFYYEKKIAQHAEKLIAIAPGMENYIKEKFQVDRTAYVKPACVDMNKFSLQSKKDSNLLSELNLKDKIVCLYAGKFGGIYLEKEVFDFFKAAADKWKDKIVFLLLTNEERTKLDQLILSAKLDAKQFIIRFVKHSEIEKWIGLADFALCPVKPVPTKKYCSPIKTGEYWSMGLPVVITDNISNDSSVIEQNNAGYVLKSLNDNEYEKAIDHVSELLKEDPSELSIRIRKLAEQYRNFEIARKIYSEIYR